MIDLADVPGGDEVAARVEVVFETVDESGDLVDNFAIVPFPSAPLLTVNGTELTIFVGPFVLDADAIFFEVSDVGIAFEKPEELVDD